MFRKLNQLSAALALMSVLTLSLSARLAYAGAADPPPPPPPEEPTAPAPYEHYDPDALVGFTSHGGSAQWDFCYGKANDTPLPVDPRSLVQPGVNEGRAVHFNSYWKDCHMDPEAIQEEGAARTCGELRDRFNRGERLLTGGSVGVASLFTGNYPITVENVFGIATMTRWQYNNLWKQWGGYWTRPERYDDLLSERYGSPLPEVPNPYPLEGEDPNKTNGGSGQLPLMFTQLRNQDGSWSGRIGVTCHACHSGKAGDDIVLGGGSSLADLDLFLRDGLPLGYLASVASLANLNHTRGTNNASDINLAFLFPDEEPLSPKEFLGLINSGSTASMDTPAWWNMGHRPTKFVDGVFPMDAPRVDMVFYTPILGLFGDLPILGPVSEIGQDWMRRNAPGSNTWIETLKAPEYPGEIDMALAEEGAVLFHELDMWAPERGNPVRRPMGNGSCASCHGAYSPRYVNDPDFLQYPELAGMSSYIVPQEIIGTDQVRWQTNNAAVQAAGAKNFFGYPPTQGTDNDCGPQNQDHLRGDREDGYLAPPLHGVWASAPYFHNGSVPNVWEVLKPSDRRPIWRRVSKPKIKNPWWNNGNVVMGFDTDFDRAYDQTRLGWDYDEIACEWRSWWNPAVTPYFSCDPNDEYATPVAQQLLAGLFDNLILAWNLLFPPTITQQQIEDRKIYNTLLYSQGNEGHEFNEVLTDYERLAIIEYLKTL